LTRYFLPWSPREKLYYTLMFARDLQDGLPWHDWYPAFAPFIKSLFPYSLIGEGDTVVQVGANRHFMWLRGASHPFVLAECVGPKGRVIAVESLHENVVAIEEAKKIAQRPWIELFNYAASDHAGELEGMAYEDQSYFWDPRTDIHPSVKEATSSRHACQDLRSHWDRVLTGSVRSSVRCERVEAICDAAGASPSFCNLTINGYEPVGIRGLGRLLEGDLIIAFPVRATEAFWHTGFFDELEGLGFALVLSNTPHTGDYPWFPTVTAMRPHHLGRIKQLISGRFVLDERHQVISFEGADGRRMLLPE
jgi:FkbM family methyltransferase